MADPQTPQKRPLVIPIRIFLMIILGAGVVSAGMHLGQSRGWGRLPLVLQVGGLLICLFGAWLGSQSLRLTGPARPVRRAWGNREVAVSREGLVFIVILMTTFIAAFLGRSNLLLLVFSFLSAILVLNGAVTNLMFEKNRVRRRLPRRVMVGETLAVEVTLSNKRLWLSSWLMVLQDQIVNSREILHPRVLFRRIPPSQERSTWYQVRFGQRGLYQFGPLKLLTRFPLGFVERATIIDEPGSIIVHPRIGLLTPTWRNESADAEDLMRNPRSRAGTHDDEFHRLREYRSGDNPKAVHWLTSARKNELMVREYHETRDRDLILVLDLHSSLPPHQIQQNIEQAISFAATLCVDHCRRNRGAKLAFGIAGNRKFFWRGTSGPNTIPHLLDELAQAVPAQNASLDELLETAGELQWGKCHRLLVSTRAASGISETLARIPPRDHSDFRQLFKIIPADPANLKRLIHWE